MAIETSDADCRKYIRVLERDMKDRRGRWLHRGDEVLVDPEDPTSVEKATDEAKRVFIGNGCGFRRNLPPQTLEMLKNAGSEINRFGSAIAENMKRMVGRTVPGKNLPWWVNLIPYPLTAVFRNQKEITNGASRDEFIDWLNVHGFIPRLETLCAFARNALADSTFFRVWELTFGSICFRVFGVYVAPVEAEGMVGKKGDIFLYNGIKRFIHDWEERNCAKATCKCYILGSSCGWEDFSTVVLPDGVEILCSPSEQCGSWTVLHQDLSPFRKVFRSFVYALYPETLEQRRGRVVKALEQKIVSGSQTAEKLSQVCGIPEELVEEVFDDLQRDAHSGWMNYVTEDAKNATRARSGGRAGRAPVFQKRRMPLVQILLYLVILGLIATSLLIRQMVADIGLLIGSLAIAATSCVQGYIERKLT